MKTAINPGHYPGLESGAINQNTGLQEADVALSVANKLSRLLQYFGHETIVIQRNELYEITDESNSFGADLFISIHCNASDNPEANGTETFCCPGSGNGSRLAECIQAELIAELGLRDRGVKEANFYVLKHTDAPAVLIELAFISNDNEAALLTDESWQQRAAEAIVRGVQQYEGA